MFSWPIQTCFTSPSWPPTLVGGMCGETHGDPVKEWHWNRQWWSRWSMTVMINDATCCNICGQVEVWFCCMSAATIWICQAWTSSVYGSGWGWCRCQVLKLRHVVVSLWVAKDHFADLAVYSYLNVMVPIGTSQAVNESKTGTCLSRKLWCPYGASIATFSKSVRT